MICSYLSEKRSLEDRAVIFVVAVECYKKWGINQPNIFFTPSLHATHLNWMYQDYSLNQWHHQHFESSRPNKIFHIYLFLCRLYHLHMGISNGYHLS